MSLANLSAVWISIRTHKKNGCWVMQKDKTDCNRYLQAMLLLVALHAVASVIVWINDLVIFRNISISLKPVFPLDTAWILVQFWDLTKKMALWMSAMRKWILIILCGQEPNIRHIVDNFLLCYSSIMKNPLCLKQLNPSRILTSGGNN